MNRRDKADIIIIITSIIFTICLFALAIIIRICDL
jgi:hypothetical protein